MTYGEKTHFDVISIDVTGKCNFSCKHCFNYSGSRDDKLIELKDEEIMTLSEDIIEQKPSVVCVCGGEPLLRKDLSLNLIRTLKNGGIENVNMVSNGYLLNENYAKEIKNSGVDVVQISVDGSKPNSHDWIRNKEGSFEKAITAIKNLRKEGVKVGVACTPTKRNLDEVEELIDMLNEYGVMSFRMQPIMNLGRAKSIEEFFPSKIDYIKLSRQLNSYSNDKRYKINIEWGDPMEHIYAWSHGYKVRSLSISAYGDLMISPYIPISFGNILNHPLPQYIEAGISTAYSLDGVKELIDLMSNKNELDINSFLDVVPKLYDADFIPMDILADDIKNKCLKLKKQVEGVI